MSFLDLKAAILDRDLCARCGACVAICPEKILEVENSSEPHCTLSLEAAADRCGSCRLCLDVCPGQDTGVPASEMRLFGRTRTPEERWTGVYRRALNIAARDPALLTNASAGGAATGLLIAALRGGLVDAVLVIGRDAERPWVPTAVLTDDERTVRNCAQSTYCLSPNLHMLRDTPFRRIGMVGVPCEIQAVQKMKRLPAVAAIADRIVFTLEIACASSTRLEGTEHLIQNRLGLSLDEVQRVRYRDGAYPGEFAAYTREGERHALPFFELVEEFKKFKTHRCLTCRDWWSGLADVSISDGDPNIYAASIDGQEGRRHSVVLVRTEMGERLVRLGEELGVVSARAGAFDPEESLGLQRKRFRSAHYARTQPDRVPTPPVLFDETVEERADDEVIASMTRKRLEGGGPEKPSGKAPGKMTLEAREIRETTLEVQVR